MQIIDTNLYHPNGFTRRSKTDMVVVHHAAAKSASVEDINRWHNGNGWNGIGYHYYIRKDGGVYRGRPEWAVGSHAIDSNDRSIGICCEGDYMTETMPAAQLVALKALLREIMGRYGKMRLVRHKDVCSTDCPGDRFPWAEVQNYMEDDEMLSYEQFKAYMGQYESEQTHKNANEFGKTLETALNGLIAAGSLKGKGGSEAYKGLDLTERDARVLTIAKNYTDKVFDDE